MAIILVNLTTWVDSYRPTKCRITFYATDSHNVVIGLKDENEDGLGGVSGSGATLNGGSETIVEFNLTFGSYNIYKLQTTNQATNYTYSIRNIEFKDSCK